MTYAEKQAAGNTDREIYRRTEGDYYSPSIFVTADDKIGVSVGGLVIVKPVEHWHGLAHLDVIDRLDTFAARLTALEKRLVDHKITTKPVVDHDSVNVSRKESER